MYYIKVINEKTLLENELNSVGKIDPEHPGDWNATSRDIAIDSADDNEVADKLEEYETNKGVMDKLQKQLSEVDAALERIENGTYGICENTHKPIDRDRLEANPSARISLK
jgi:DnaK suppressor protein